MIDKRIGRRIKECRENIGLTQEQFAEKIGMASNYISTVQRGASFPRCENLIAIINGLGVSADAIFCDVLDQPTDFQKSRIFKDLSNLPPAAQKRILQMMELMIRQEMESSGGSGK